jgi:hypothetical protein
MKTIEINLDFDGTVVTHAFPKVGKDVGAVPVLKRLVSAGHRLILFTMRSDRDEKKSTKHEDILDVTGNFLTDAIYWFKKNDIPLYGIQSNPTQKNWTTSPKSYAALMIDDSALGTPMIYPSNGERPYVDWVKVEKLLENMGLL